MSANPGTIHNGPTQLVRGEHKEEHTNTQSGTARRQAAPTRRRRNRCTSEVFGAKYCRTSDPTVHTRVTRHTNNEKMIITLVALLIFARAFALPEDFAQAWISNFQERMSSSLHPNHERVTWQWSTNMSPSTETLYRRSAFDISSIAIDAMQTIAWKDSAKLNTTTRTLFAQLRRQYGGWPHLATARERAMALMNAMHNQYSRTVVRDASGSNLQMRHVLPDLAQIMAESRSPCMSFFVFVMHCARVF